MQKRKGGFLFRGIAGGLAAVFLLSGCGKERPAGSQVLQPAMTDAALTAEATAEQWKDNAQPVTEVEIPEWIDVQLIPVHGEARRGVKLEGVKNIVLHYVGNPGSTAQNNRDFFASDSAEVSAHFVVGLEGEIIQCVPLDEKSSASNFRNKDTISIETCHPDESGKYTKETYDAEVKLVAWLCNVYGLTEQDVIRHYDVTGKICPKWFVEDSDAWEGFLADVKKALENGDFA